jgi:predicted deacetylase
MSADELKSARLLFAPELADGRIEEAQLAHTDVDRAVRSRPVPAHWRRALERLLIRRGLVSYERDCVERFAEARRAVLGEDAAGPPRVLVRVDEFPHARAFDEPERYGRANFERFHSILHNAGVPYLLAVTPFLSHDYLDPEARGGRGIDESELALLRRLADEGVSFALHGWDHRTRYASPRRRSELGGLPVPELVERLERARSELSDGGIDTPVLVPPFNRFDAKQYPALAERFAVVCGGPETVPLLGYHRTPLWRQGAVYLPAYAPFYERASAVRPALERLAATRPGVWLPVVLHWGWEADDGWEPLERLAELLAPLAVGWDEFIEMAG